MEEMRNMEAQQFEQSVEALRTSLREVMATYVEDHRAVLLLDLLENQLEGIIKFFKLLSSEGNDRLSISEEDFNKIVSKYIPVSRYFARLPDDGMKSTYKMAITTEFYFVLRRHCPELG